VKLPLILALLATTASVFGVVALPPRWFISPTLPPAGKYVGLLTVRRTLLQEELETTFTVRAVATIAADGRMTILTATPEAPGAAANIENSVVRAAPRQILVVSPGGVLPHPIVNVSTTNTAPAAPSSPLQPGNTLSPGTVLYFANYLVNNDILASLTVENRTVRLRYTLTQPQSTPVGVGTVPVSVTLHPATISAPISSPVAVSGTNTSPASQPASSQFIPATPGPLPVPVSQVSYDFVLRFERPLTAPAAATLPH
jgi:hypothetical protein